MVREQLQTTSSNNPIYRWVLSQYIPIICLKQARDYTDFTLNFRVWDTVQAQANNSKVSNSGFIQSPGAG